MIFGGVIVCRCGAPMALRKGYYVCANEDYPQPEEYLGRKRRMTQQDRRFELTWRSIVRTEYPKTFDKNGRDLAA